MSSSSFLTRIFVKQDLQQIGQVCRVDLSRPMADILIQISHQFPAPNGGSYTKLLLIDDDNKYADFEIVRGSDIERGDKLLLQWQQEDDVAENNRAATTQPTITITSDERGRSPSPAAAAHRAPSLARSLVTPSMNTINHHATATRAAARKRPPPAAEAPLSGQGRKRSASVPSRSAAFQQQPNNNNTATTQQKPGPPNTRSSPIRRKNYSTRRRTRNTISKCPLPIDARQRLSNIPFVGQRFKAYCETHISESTAISYTGYAEMLFRNEEYSAPHWEYPVCFAPQQETPTTLASDFVTLHAELVTLEEENCPADGSSERTPMRGALTYLDLYQRYLLSTLKDAKAAPAKVVVDSHPAFGQKSGTVSGTFCRHKGGRSFRKLSDKEPDEYW